jgi:hypothetical protein
MVKRFFLFTALIAMASTAVFSHQSKKAKKVAIYGHINFIPVYKGGIRPTDEMMKACCSPRPLANKTIYIKKSYYSKPCGTLHTDTAGNFSIKITPGNYNLYFENETSKPAQERSCEEWLTRAQAVIEVQSKNNKKFDLVIREALNPCEPMPESAPPRKD